MLACSLNPPKAISERSMARLRAVLWISCSDIRKMSSRVTSKRGACWPARSTRRRRLVSDQWPDLAQYLGSPVQISGKCHRELRPKVAHVGLLAQPAEGD